MQARPSIRAPLAADWALSHGISALTTAEIAELLGVPAAQVSQRLAEPVRRTEWVTPARGLWVPVPPQYRGWGGPPPLEVVADLARFCEVDYYVGWLSAAAVYGAGHQAAQVTQVAVSRAVRTRTVGRARLTFHVRARATAGPVRPHTVRTGPVRVATPELTVLDLTTDILAGGGLDNVATVVVELADDPGLDLSTLAALAETFPVAAVRRVGWILEQHTDVSGLDVLSRVGGRGYARPSRLSPHAPDVGPVDQRWQVRVNRTVEVEA